MDVIISHPEYIEIENDKRTNLAIISEDVVSKGDILLLKVDKEEHLQTKVLVKEVSNENLPKGYYVLKFKKL